MKNATVSACIQRHVKKWQKRQTIFMTLKTFSKLHSAISNHHQLLTWSKVHVLFEIYKIQNLLFNFGQVQSKCKHWSSTNYITYLKLITVMHIAWNITYRKKVGSNRRNYKCLNFVQQFSTEPKGSRSSFNGDGLYICLYTTYTPKT